MIIVDGVRRRPGMATGLLAAIMAAILYSVTAAPTVYWSDSAELQRVAYSLAPSHPPGYPLYELLTRLWIVCLPTVEVARAVTLFSVACAVGAVGVVAWLTWRLGGDPLAATFAGLVLATAPSFWSQAIVAEVYSLHALLIALLIVATLSRRPNVVVVALLLGLALAHHRMALLVLPGVLLALVIRRDELTAGRFRPAAIAPAFLLGMAPYLLPWLRGDWASFAAFGAYVTHRGDAWIGTTDLGGYLASNVWPLVAQQLDVAGVVLAAVGWLWCMRRDDSVARSAAACLGASWVVAVAFLTVYRVPDSYAFATHLQVIQAMLMGLGVVAACSWIGCLVADGRGHANGGPEWPQRYGGLESRGRNGDAATRRGPGRLDLPRWHGGPASLQLGLSVGTGVVVALVLVAQARAGWAANRHAPEDWRYPRQRALEGLRDVASESVLVADWLLGQTMLYLQDVDGVRPDVTVVIPPAQDVAVPLEYLGGGRPVYLWGSSWAARFAGRLDGRGQPYQLVPADRSLFETGLFRLTKSDVLVDSPERRIAIGHAIVPGLAVDHVTVRPWPLLADALAELDVCWSGDSAQLADRRLLVALDPEHEWLRRTYSDLAPSESGCTRLLLLVPPAPYAAQVTAQLVLEPVPSEERSDDGVAGNGGDPTAVPIEWAVAVQPSAPTAWSDRFSFLPALAAPFTTRTPDAEPNAILGSAQVVGLEYARTTRPGVGVPLTVYWWLPEGADPGREVAWWIEGTGGAAGQATRTALAPGFTASHWRGPGLVATRVILDVLHRARAGAYRIVLAPPGQTEPIAMGEVTVGPWPRIRRPPPVAETVDFTLSDGAVKLVGFDLAWAGRRLTVTLSWHCVRAVDADWKVFVHLLDDTGELVAQHDGVPGDGWRWTDSWRPGEYILDPHQLELPPDPGEGPYQLVVGLYDPASGARVIVHSPAGPSGGAAGGLRLPTGTDADAAVLATVVSPQDLGTDHRAP